MGSPINLYMPDGGERGVILAWFAGLPMGATRVWRIEMSYCRWSSDNWMCDVYVYEDCAGGWTTHVAGRKRICPPIPDLPFWRFPRFGGEWDKSSREMVYPGRLRKLAAKLVFGFAAFWHNRVHMASLNLIPIRPIGKRYDGESFNDDSLEELLERLNELKTAGYRIPQYVFERIKEEMQAESA